MTDRDAKVQEVEISIEEDLELMGLTGVEDKLQVCSAYASIVGELLLTRSHSDSLSLCVSFSLSLIVPVGQVNVRTTLEKLRHAGIKVWMLTGDKIETATCVARSSKLVARNQSIYQIVVQTPEEARHHLVEFAQIQLNTVLVIDGTSLQICLDHHKELFFNSSRNAPSVVCCRCSPTQKACKSERCKSESKRTLLTCYACCSVVVRVVVDSRIL
jgi:phospholipid-translocating ATPase